MSVIQYLDGSTLTSTALTNEQISSAMQMATAQMLGIVCFTETMTLTAGSDIATPAGMGNLQIGYLLTGDGVPAGTTIAAVNPSTIQMSAPATLSGPQQIDVAQPNAYSLVRVGWQQQGQPAWGITDDIVILRCSTVPSDFSQMRDITNTAGADSITQTDTFTRAWRTFWTFYGPNSLDRARAVRSALIKIPFVFDLLAESNLYVNPDIAEPGRNPEEFQGEWRERVDMSALFNEEVTETSTVGIAASVAVAVSTKDGQIDQFTVQL